MEAGSIRHLVAVCIRLPLRFTLALNVNAGNQINIDAAPGFILTCSDPECGRAESECRFSVWWHLTVVKV